MSHYEYQIYLPHWLGQALAREADEAGLSVRRLLLKILAERYSATTTEERRHGTA